MHLKFQDKVDSLCKYMKALMILDAHDRAQSHTLGSQTQFFVWQKSDLFLQVSENQIHSELT